IQQILSKLTSVRDKRIALLGLSFKPETDDVREAPSLSVLSLLLAEGAHVYAYDPIAIPRVKSLFPSVTYVETPYEAMAGAGAALLVTEWKECVHLDWQRVKDEMKSPWLFDGRNAWPVHK
ncbi:UDP-glucose 6-dehydrogenase, partial [Microbacteriaceae bacterium K1510]|nr:UDP-glucose 6-dehydrogenase [Microbacteriaceae bacterium K1510]